MWAFLPSWLVEDGEIPELRVGQELSHVGLRASCWSIRHSNAPEGVRELPGPDPDGERAVHYELTGTVQWSRAPGSALLRIGDLEVLAEPTTFREVPGSTSSDFALEPFSPDFPIPTTGRRVSVVGRLQVMADYEWDDFGFPDTRRDWEVVAVRVEHRAWMRNAAGVGTPGAVVRVDTADRVAAADLDRDLCSDYRLDLRPIR